MGNLRWIWQTLQQKLYSRVRGIHLSVALPVVDFVCISLALLEPSTFLDFLLRKSTLKLSFTRFHIDVTVIRLLCCYRFAYSTYANAMIFLLLYHSLFTVFLCFVLFFFLIATKYTDRTGAPNPCKKKKKKKIRSIILRPSLLSKQGHLYNYRSTCDLKDDLVMIAEINSYVIFCCRFTCYPFLPLPC